MSDAIDLPVHLPVMPGEVLELLAPRAGETAVDGTVGLGGHARLVGERLGPDGRLICFDRDPAALELARRALEGLACRRDFVNEPFDCMEAGLRLMDAPFAHTVLLDLGVSSMQLDRPERGFSFMRDGPLDMRMDPNRGQSARDIVNGWPEEKLRHIFEVLGEERFSRRLAKSVVERRAEKPIETTGELSALAAAVVPRRGRIHPATRIFQALRMQVNDELGGLSRGLAAAGRVLAPGGRLAVITFHSLEDRLVKRVFARWSELGAVALVNAKPLIPGDAEIAANPRARSAKLRVVEKIRGDAGSKGKEVS